MCVVRDLTLNQHRKGHVLVCKVVEEVFGLPRAIVQDEEGYQTIFDYSLCLPHNNHFAFSEVRVGNTVELRDPLLQKMCDDQVGILCSDASTVKGAASAPSTRSYENINSFGRLAKNGTCHASLSTVQGSGMDGCLLL